MLFGKAFQSEGTLKVLFAGVFNCSVTICCLVGYFIFFYLLLCFLVLQMSLVKKEDEAVTGITYLIFEKYPIWAPFIILVVCWLPYLIACYPGVVQWDGFRQLLNSYSLNTSDNSHPVFTTLLFGCAMRVGRYFGNDNLGVFIYVFPQMLIVAGITAHSIKQFKKMSSPYWLRWGTLVYFAFISLWPLYAVSLFKDTLFYSIFLEYMVLIIQSIEYGDKFWKNAIKIVEFIIVLLLLQMIRRNGIHIVVLSMPFVILAGWKRIKNIRGWIVFFSAIAGFMLWDSVVVPMLGVSPGRSNEALSAIFQQTARYVSTYPDEVTEEEKKIISNILDYDVLLNEYDPEFSDPVKNSYNFDVTEEEKKEYFRVWWQQFCKHPGIYFEATLEGAYGYYYPNKTEYREGLGAYSITSDERINDGTFSIHMSDKTAPLREILENLSYVVRNVPIVGILFSNGIYTWIAMISVATLIKVRRWKEIVPYIPVFLVILICFVSPVNAYIRYMRPAMVCTPLLLGWLLYVQSKERDNYNEKISDYTGI
jgi:hypothetical protein